MNENTHIPLESSWLSEQFTLIAAFQSQLNPFNVVVIRYWGGTNAKYAVHNYYSNINAYENGFYEDSLHVVYAEFFNRCLREIC